MAALLLGSAGSLVSVALVRGEQQRTAAAYQRERQRADGTWDEPHFTGTGYQFAAQRSGVADREPKRCHPRTFTLKKS